MNFGDCLKSILDDREISQREFARQLNIAPTTLNGYIRNTRQPDFELVKKIADKLGVSVDYLFGTEGNRDYTFAERELIMNYRQMTDENKKLFKQLSAELAKHI